MASKNRTDLEHVSEASAGVLNNSLVASTTYNSDDEDSDWIGPGAGPVPGFACELIAPSSGTVIAHMSAMVGVDTDGGMCFLGPAIAGQLRTECNGGIRGIRARTWVGTAASNCVRVSAGLQTIQVNMAVHAGKALVTHGHLFAQFIPDPPPTA